MLMSSSRRNKIIIISISVIVVIALAIYAYLYFNTDMFKSNSILFAKYIGKAAENLEVLINDENGENYDNLLENNKYTSSTEITAKYRSSIGTTGENSDNVINNLKLTINGKTDKLSGVDYKDFVIQKEDNNIAEAQYLKSNDMYGLRFVGLFDKYIAVKNQDLKQVASKMEIEGNIPDKIEDVNLKTEMRLTQDEINTLNDRYKEVAIKDFSKDKFSKTKKTSITIDDQTVETNAYTLNLTKEELNNIYIAILEQIKQDDIFLARVDLLDRVFNAGLIEETQGTEGQENQESQEGEQQQEEQTENEEEQENATVREKFIKKIDDIITQIKNKNIGSDASSITVYESEGKTVRVAVETPSYEVILDTFIQDGANSFIRLYSNMDKSGVDLNEDEILIEKSADNLYINRKQNVGEETYKTNYAQERIIENGRKETGIRFTYDIGKSKIEVNAVDKKEIVNNFDNIEEFTDNNNVVLNDFTDDDYTELKEVLNDKGIEKLEAVSQEVNIDDLFKALNELGILPEQIEISNVVTLTLSEVSRFNAEFEIYKGQEVTAKEVDNLLQIVKDNLDTIEVLSDTQIRLNIKKGTSNEQLTNKVSEIINNDKNKSKKYSMQYEYDEETQMIKDIIIEILENNT